MNTYRLTCVAVLAWSGMGGAPAAQAQESPARRLAFPEAVAAARARVPALRAAHARAAAAAAGVGLARTAYAPRLDLLWQTNRATRNNVFGLVLPQPVAPAISGPVLGTNSSASTWGTVAGALFTWEMLDFGRRGAVVAAAQAGRSVADATAALTEMDVLAGVADAFLATLAVDAAVRAAQASVDRMEVFTGAVDALVTNDLRPGVDRVRAQAELATARIHLIRAEQAAAIQRGLLAEALGDPGTVVAPDTGALLARLPDLPPTPASVEAHPEAMAYKADALAGSARTRALERAFFPRFNAQFAVYSRGSGALLNGDFNHDKGLGLDINNWAAGVTMTWPLFDAFSLRKARQVETQSTAAAEARYDQSVQRLETGVTTARAVADATRRIADNTPVQLQAARDTQTLTRVRYEAGLSTVVEVAEAERLLTQAEIDDAVARLNVWRAAVALARARGDLTPVLAQAGAPTGEGRP